MDRTVAFLPAVVRKGPRLASADPPGGVLPARSGRNALS
jgi:hypothetical protein